MTEQAVAKEIADLLVAIGLDKYVDVCVEAEIDVEAAHYLSEDDLKELGLPMGPRRKFAAAIARQTTEPPVRPGEPEAEQAAAQAERRQLTLMFCDLVGSTALSRNLDPEDLRELMGRYQDAVAGCVARYEGHVAKYLGDGVLAYFGWPQAFEDQAERAARASLDAVRAVRELDDGADAPLAARAGIATGRVVVGDLLGDVAADAGAVTGETPNLAARLQDAASPGDVLIDAATRRMLASAFQMTDLGDLPLKGFDRPVQAWRIEREGEATDRFGAFRASRVNSLVGRDHELALVLDRWRQAQRGGGQIVTLTGEAGFGKSRLTRAISAAIKGDAHVHITYQCSPLHTNTPLYPVVRHLSRAAGFADDDPPNVKTGKLEQLIAASAGDLQTAMPIFAALMSVPAGDGYAPIDLDPPQLRARMIATLVEQATALSRTSPLLLILEDAHWIDPTTEEFIVELAAGLASAPILLLATQRPEYRAPWSGDVRATTVVLNRLGHDQSAEIIRAVAGDGVPSEIVDSIAERAGGVPLYLEELTKSVIEGGADSDASQRPEVPETLQASLLARLDRLGNAKEVAQIGAVIGREFDRQLLIDVAELEPEAATAALTQLVNSELLLRRGADEDVRYVFKHALIQDAAYDSLLVRRRKELHRRIVAVMAQSPGRAKDDQVEALAYHARLGALWDRALNYCRRAGKRANERSAHKEALQFLEAGLAAAKNLPDDRETTEQVLDIYMNLRPSLGAFGMYERLLDSLSEASRLANTLGQGAVATVANINKTHVLHHLGRIEDGIAVGEETVDLSTRHGERGMILAASAVLAMGYFFHGEIERAARLASEHVEELATDFRHENLATTATSSVNWLGNLSGMLTDLGRFREADRWSSEALRISAETGKPFDKFQSNQWRGNYLIGSGQAGEAIAILEPMCAMIEDQDFGFGRPWAYGWLGAAYLAVGDHAKAEETLLYANSTARKLGLAVAETWNLLRLADVFTTTGRPDEALAHAAEVAARGRHGGDWWHLPYMLRLRARALAEMGELDDALSAIKESITSAESRKAAPEVGHGRQALASILARQNDPEGARRERAKARRIYEQLGVSNWVTMLDEKAEDA